MLETSCQQYVQYLSKLCGIIQNEHVFINGVLLRMDVVCRNHVFCLYMSKSIGMSHMITKMTYSKLSLNVLSLKFTLTVEVTQDKKNFL